MLPSTIVRFAAIVLYLIGTSATTAQQPTWHATAVFANGLYDMACLDSNRIIVSVGDLQRGLTAILGTTDGGRSWDTLLSSDNLGLKRAFKELAYLDTATILALSPSEGSLWRTTDRGRRWDTAAIGGESVLTSLSVRPDGYGAVIAYPNTILSTSDAGRTWAPLPLGDSVRAGYLVRTVVCLDSTTFVSALDNGRASFALGTTDRGGTWSTGYFPTTHPNVAMMAFTDHLHGWLVGVREGSFTNVLIYRTRDGGLHWESVFGDMATTPFTDVSFRSEDEGIVASPAYIARTTDGGDSWTKETIDQIVGQSTIFTCTPQAGTEVVYTGNGYVLTKEAASLVRADSVRGPAAPINRILRGTGRHFLEVARLEGHEARLFDERGRVVEVCVSSVDAGRRSGVWVTPRVLGNYWLVEARNGMPVARIVVLP